MPRSADWASACRRSASQNGIIYPLRETVAIKQFQVIQEAIDSVIIRLVAAPSFSADDRRQLLKRAQAVLGRDIDIAIECVETIPRPASGKHRYVISKVAEEFIKHGFKAREAVSAAL
jgi:phenylacetate-CoA ligase